MTTYNFWSEIMEEVGEENIESFVIGAFSGRNIGDRYIPEDKIGITLSKEEAKKYLNYKYRNNFGTPDCHAFWAWTPTRIIFISEYDGLTSINSLPRNPIASFPYKVGFN